MITLTEKTFPQPTLSIYLGGTGILVGDSLLTMLETLPDAERAFVETFFIDSQEPTIRDHERARHYCYSDLGVFSQPIYEGFTERRFPENLGVNPVVSSCDGCGVTRIFGAASLVACRDDFTDLVERANARLPKDGASAQPLQVFLTASACGGTGAGMILDAAALVRHVCRTRIGSNPRIFLFLLGPTAFFEDPTINLREDQRHRMQASTYALLKELHHFAQGNEFVSAYRLRDEIVRIGNSSDDDRLFDWVFFIDGRAEQGAPRSLAEVTWTVAEAQLHLGVSEVGRKVAESLPNQREERVRSFGLHFVHPDNKHRLSEAARDQLAKSSRTTFLASLAVRSVYFPAEEIKSWFRWRWVHEALDKTVDRRAVGGGVALVDEFDRLLGYDDGDVLEEGLLKELGLRAEQLLQVVAERDLSRGMAEGPSPSMPLEGMIQGAGELLDVAASLLAELREEPAAPAPGAERTGGPLSGADLLAAALPRWSAGLAAGLAAGGRSAERLWSLAWDPVEGRGLRWLDAFLTHTADLLTQLAQRGVRRPQLADLEMQLGEARQLHQWLARSYQRESRTLGFRWRAVRLRLAKLALLDDKQGPASDALQRKTKRLARQLTDLRGELLAQRRAQLLAALAPQAWLEAARLLRRWREEALLPTLTVAENALALAHNQRALARDGLAVHQGEGRRGRWRALSTVSVADDELLAQLSRRLEDRVQVEYLVLGPLGGRGLSRERHRLSIDTFRRTDARTVVDILHAHVAAETTGPLAIIDGGWNLEEARDRLRRSAAKALDEGAQPLVRFARAAVGLQLQGYFLAPRELVLPRPFGRTVGQMTPLSSRDPLRLGVVSFAFGIPPNALYGMDELFAQYTNLLGDQERNRGVQDRYPLHVFRGAAESFDEPYSPLTLEMDEVFLHSLLQVARELGIDDGRRIVLDIRQFDNTKHELERDWNRLIELAEKVVQRLDCRPEEVDRLFRNGEYSEIAHFYNSRRRRGGPGSPDGSPQHGTT
ncbi:MAG TPA: tubulin-like doman-containing protein [Thermoanaerobaculia bacterium]|nr:tubulin-like doman-containing protein [Thermoanaerobaculia bacterium]